MKQLFLSFAALWLNLGLWAQSPVTWHITSEQVDGTTYIINFKAHIADGWFTYSQHLGDDGPVPTSITVESAGTTALGAAQEVSNYRKEGFDPLFGINVIKFGKEVTFKQKIKTSGPDVKKVTGYLTYMVCDDKQCLPPTDLDFDVNLPVTTKRSGPETGDKPKPATSETGKAPKVDERLSVGGSEPAQAETTPEALPGTAEQIASPDSSSAEASTEAPAAKPEEDAGQADAIGARFVQGTRFLPDLGIVRSYAAQCVQAVVGENSLWGIFLLGFVAGLLALLTPCVFPMIPLTVSFFTKSSTTRAKGIANATKYGLSIMVIYTGIGTVLSAAFGPDFLNMLSTHWIPNTLFFLIFVAFALSFFGLYEITLPSSWANSSDRAADKGGFLGIFFMAFTLSLVSFSCTGPLIGTLLVESAAGGADAGGTLGSLFGIEALDRVALRPVLGMFGFSLALALPFALFAAFPSWLNSMPKSGGWMNTVKVSLGFLELALALKFLSVADMVSHWEFLKYELFLGLWVLIFSLWALYMFGLIKIGHESPMKKLPIARLALGTVLLGFTVYLATGFSYKPLYLLSGLAPPVHYNFFRPMDCPHGLDCYKDLDEGLRVAQAEGKPVMLDFTGYGCVNCRKMEEHVWPEEDILKMLNEDYVIISLYTDDSRKLAQVLEYTDKEGQTRKLRTVGSKWAALEQQNFDMISQPYYVLLDKDGKTLLNNGREYTPDAAIFQEFLECGLENFNALQEKSLIGEK